jgi:hypothetical protein
MRAATPPAQPGDTMALAAAAARYTRACASTIATMEAAAVVKPHHRSGRTQREPEAMREGRECSSPFTPVSP